MAYTLKQHTDTHTHTYSEYCVSVNTLSESIKSDLGMTVPLGNPLRGSGAAATAPLLPWGLSGPLSAPPPPLQ